MPGESKTNEFSVSVLMGKIARERQILNKKITKPRIAGRNSARRACAALDEKLANKKRISLSRDLIKDLQERLSVGKVAAVKKSAKKASRAADKAAIKREREAKKAKAAAKKAALEAEWHTPKRLTDPNGEDVPKGKNGGFLRYRLHRTSNAFKLINPKNWTQEARDMILSQMEVRRRR